MGSLSENTLAEIESQATDQVVNIQVRYKVAYLWLSIDSTTDKT